MIQLKVFSIEDTEAFNAFVKEHPPRATDNWNGITFHEGHIVVFYEDGTYSKASEIDELRKNLISEKYKLFVAKRDLKKTQIALPKEKAAMKKAIPPGYTMQTTDTELRKMVTKDHPEYLSAEALKELRDGFDLAIAKVMNLENQAKQDEHQIKLCEIEIETYETMLKEYE